ncbi:hypothetical protein F9L16_00395 [Agarivorans sp. B2Z047]|uniref:hypothetical protein n=1 Tax=Agarivorans sp. B2Z047 TaxID=2652721 RepID=UPI00128DB5B0|nr:hypothetical protein [Agarivorans sp. B2Z047]MPW27466.1 hypothetical protein [Agarivorans sp. B2Z047]UQN44692.1 hypothetical protein LQZ07_09555 [Agarivorans sp. B2Z047]
MRLLPLLLLLIGAYANAANLSQQQIDNWFEASKMLKPIVEKIEEENTLEEVENPSELAEQMVLQLNQSAYANEVKQVLDKYNLDLEHWAATTEQVIFAILAVNLEEYKPQLEVYENMKQQLLDNPELSAEQKQQLLESFEIGDQWFTQLQSVPQSDIDLIAPQVSKISQELGWEFDTN